MTSEFYGLDLCFLCSLKVQDLIGSESLELGAEEESEGGCWGGRRWHCSTMGEGRGAQTPLPPQHRKRSGGMLGMGIEV